MGEAELGYPFHKAYAIGNLSEAEEEAINKYPDIAQRIRKFRMAYMEGEKVDSDFLMEDLYEFWKEMKK